MNQIEDTSAEARRIVDANMYMTLATADDDGRPWASPVWYAPVTYAEFLWMSAPEARHSRRSQACGARAWEAADVLPPVRFRLYRATASSRFVLGPHDQRLPVGGSAS